MPPKHLLLAMRLRSRLTRSPARPWRFRLRARFGHCDPIRSDAPPSLALGGRSCFTPMCDRLLRHPRFPCWRFPPWLLLGSEPRSSTQTQQSKRAACRQQVARDSRGPMSQETTVVPGLGWRTTACGIQYQLIQEASQITVGDDRVGFRELVDTSRDIDKLHERHFPRYAIS